jgi:MFS family permease
MDDLSLSTTDYNSVVSILFVGYIGFQVPSNMIIGKISRPALYICLACAAWGVVSALTAAVHNYVGLMMARVALGITEAVFVSPGLSSHVPQALRSGIDAHSIFISSPVRSST